MGWGVQVQGRQERARLPLYADVVDAGLVFREVVIRLRIVVAMRALLPPNVDVVDREIRRLAKSQFETGPAEARPPPREVLVREDEEEETCCAL